MPTVTLPPAIARDQSHQPMGHEYADVSLLYGCQYLNFAVFNIVYPYVFARFSHTVRHRAGAAYPYLVGSFRAADVLGGFLGPPRLRVSQGLVTAPWVRKQPVHRIRLLGAQDRPLKRHGPL